MALVARMVAQESIDRNSTVWTPTDADDPEGKPAAEVFSNYTYGIPFWLRGHEFIRADQGHGQQAIHLTVVRSGGEDDPNNDYFTASPMGELKMTIDNPAAFGYVKAGGTYRVTIEKIVGPRNKE